MASYSILSTLDYLFNLKHNISWHTEAKTKWPPFCRHDFQLNFLVWKCGYFDLNFTEICSFLSNWQWVTRFRQWLARHVKRTSHYRNSWNLHLPIHTCVIWHPWVKQSNDISVTKQIKLKWHMLNIHMIFHHFMLCYLSYLMISIFL